MLSNVELISRLVLAAALGSAIGFHGLQGCARTSPYGNSRKRVRFENARISSPGAQACDNAASKTHAAAFPLRGAGPGRFIGRVFSRSTSRLAALSIIDLCQIPP